ncbi:MAG: aminotransferase class I/II-fold pyridoxal phosphate-dependent enzyme [Eubacteriales bacterium]
MHRYEIDARVRALGEEVQQQLEPLFREIDRVAQYNQEKVLYAFYQNRVSDTLFAGTTGYGYDDQGREVIDRLYAQVFDCEDALVRHSFVNGTHTLATALYGVLRPGDVLLSVTGKPYDTLDEVIGLRGEGNGSLREWGVAYRQVDMQEGQLDWEGMEKALTPEVKAVFIQRSKGYDNVRPTLSAQQVGEICKFCKERLPGVICIVDNCYGEFAETEEPTSHGADLIVGSLIKNPGGGMALSGGYIAGRKDLIEKISYRYTCPGIGRECGATLGQNASIIKGLFFAPHVVAQSIKTAHFCAGMYEKLGYACYPAAMEKRYDIIQAIQFGSREGLVAFCGGIQKGAPVDSYVTPEPWAMPGYSDEVIMAAGAFVQGASIELSADGPVRPPFNAYMQGGLTYESGKLGILLSVQSMLEKGLVQL